MALFSRKNIKSGIPFGLIKDDLKDDLEGLPMGVVVRMLEEQKEQEQNPDVNVFQRKYSTIKRDGGFNWRETEAGEEFWSKVLFNRKFEFFFERYPDYARYNLA